jgi:hypothetical protein
MFIIVLNQNNIVNDGGNNKLVYKFPNSINLTDKYVAVSSIAMFYSWNNIDAIYTNNTLTYTWTALGVTTTYTITIPDGIYEISELNSYFQYVMIQNLTYWTNSSGQYVYPWEISVNAVRYAIQINTYLVPTSATATTLGYVLPVGQNWPTVTQNPVITIPANFNIIIGYTAGFASNANVSNAYTPSTTVSASNNYESKNAGGTLSYLSNTSPQVQPNSNLLLNLSGINNPYSQPSGIIYSLNPSVSSGEIISEKPPNFMWTKFISGTYNELRLTLLGTDLRPLQINDPNMTILLTIRDANEGFLSSK